MKPSGDTLDIGPDDAGQRVDRFVRRVLARATLPLVYKLLRTKQITVNGRRARPEDRLAPGDAVTFFLGERFADLRGGRTPRRAPRAAPPALEVLHRDDDVAALNKPARLLVHEGDSGDEPTLQDALLRAFPNRRGHVFRPALAHRLDRDTSGVVLAGLSGPGLRGLEDLFRRRKVRKAYLALVVGVPAEREGTIDAPLKRQEVPKGDRPKVFVGGRKDPAARTDWRVLASAAGYALVEARPRTGRTHQIRVHLRHIGHPILGDPTYGDRRRNEEARGRWGLWRPFLHAASVEFEHPVTGALLRVEAPLPAELARVLTALGIREWSSAGGGGQG
ncbi:MAG TPA: RluA family pseudouridine synthase [Planctomycetota bacterium]|nr:RluA family pseudouridine synthase [Planctomycetota bacterium]